MDERRQIPRWQIGKQVECCLQDSIWLEDCHLEDINLKGLCVSLPRQLPQGQAFKVSIGLKEDFNLDLGIRLCWNKQEKGRHFYGASFEYIADKNKENLDQYLSKHCLKQFKEKWWSI